MKKSTFDREFFWIFVLCSCKLVQIQFTGFPNEWHEIIGSLKNGTNAAMDAFSLRQKNSKTQRPYDRVLIDWVRYGWRENIWLSIRTQDIDIALPLMQAFLGELVGRDEIQAPLKRPAWETRPRCSPALVLTSWPGAKYFFVRPSHSFNK